MYNFITVRVYKSSSYTQCDKLSKSTELLCSMPATAVYSIWKILDLITNRSEWGVLCTFVLQY